MLRQTQTQGAPSHPAPGAGGRALGPGPTPAPSGAQELHAALAAHDAALVARGLDVWIGGEPTFTDRGSQEPQWHHQATGGDKEPHARALLARLVRPGQVVLRTVGRQYPDEPRPRFSLGRWGRRDGTPVWSGPPDPIVGGLGASAPDAAARLRDALAARLVARGWSARAFDLTSGPGAAGQDGVRSPCPQLLWRVVARAGGGPLPAAGDPRLARPPVGSTKSPEAGLVDDLAAEGALLFAVGPSEPWPERAQIGAPPPACSTAVVAIGELGELAVVATGALARDPPGAIRLDLPAIVDVAAFQALLADVGAAAREAGLPGLVLGGFPPPVDASVASETVTPDPGVVEVNMAPCASVTELAGAYRELHAAAALEGLSPVRYRYTGEVGDSGGGGQLTLGGPSPAGSPFFRVPRLLPALVAYAARHPSLSYLWNVDSVGSASQSPRVDEGVPESWDELPLALARLAALVAELEAGGASGTTGRETPGGGAAVGQAGDEASAARWRDTLWAALAPLLADRFGNAHRSELNIEKLWNPGLPHRGRLGLVELRALRMARTPERAAALAALVRACAAMLARAPLDATITPWGPQLHDRFMLPTLLREDALVVLADLRAAGLGLGPLLEAELLDDDEQRLIGRVVRGDRVLELRRAVEPWPLVGDALAQERGTARWVDASTVRVEVLVRTAGPVGAAPLALDPDELLVAVARPAGESFVRAPLRRADLASGPVLVRGLRLRSFSPRLGLHPTVPAHGPLRLLWSPPGASDARLITVHDWRPQGGAYDGLPRDADDARARREERFEVAAAPRSTGTAHDAPAGAVTPWTLDLRWL